jgi:hypothetical protein
LWSVVSGPGTVTFGNSALPSTTASFSTAGTYVLRLTGNDSLLQASDDVTVTVSPEGTPGAAPAFRSAASAILTGASGTALTIARPSGVQAGDLLLAQIRYRDPVTGLTAPAGWTLVGTITSGQANHAVLYKVATASEPTSYTFNQGTSAGRMAGGIGAYTGVNTAAPINAWAASVGEAATLVAPSVNTTVDNALVVRLWGWRGVSASEPGVGLNVVPAGLTQRWTEQVGHVNSDRNRVLAGDRVQATAGPTGTATASGSASTAENRRNAFTIALTPAGQGGGSPTNQAPVVSAGVDQSVVLPNSALLVGSVTDDGLPAGGSLSSLWSVVSGPGSVAFVNASLPTTSASFSTAGTYVLRLTGNDSLLQASDDVTVTVSPEGTPGVAPAFRSAASAILTGASGTALTIARPAGVQAGDLLLAQIRYRDPVTGLIAPAGWTLVGTITSGQANHAVLYKVATGSEPTSYTFTQGASAGRMAGGIGAYTGVNTAAPINAWAASVGEAATLVAPSVNTTVDNALVVRLWGWRGVSASEPGVGLNVVPAGLTQRWTEQVGHVNSDRNRVLAGDRVQSTAGPTGTATASGSASTAENRRNAFTIALTPAG